MSHASILPHASAGEARERVVTDYERVVEDWYIEPYWVVDQLAHAVTFKGSIHDPCCGAGTIPKRLKHHGYITTGSDIVFRGYGLSEDFFYDVLIYDNLVFNPPYKIAEQFILHALASCSGKVAAIVNIKFLASQGRRDRLFIPHPPAQVLILSQRPSIPPGGKGIKASGGTSDYCWIVWDKQNQNTQIRWLK